METGAEESVTFSAPREREEAALRDLRSLHQYRRLDYDHMAGLALEDVAFAGSFIVASATERQKGTTRRVLLRCIASAAFEDLRWDHVSISTANRCPTWDEMEQIKRLFFEDHETAMQLHVPPADHINNHPYCLHLWRPTHMEIPRPPGFMVGVQGMSPQDVRQLLNQT